MSSNSYRLTLLIGPTLPMPAPAEVIQALTSVQVTTTSGQRSGFQLTFALSKASLLNRVLIAAGVFDPGIRVIIIVTVGAMPTVLMDGIIMRQEVAASNELGQSTCTVTGEDVSVQMDRVEIPGVPYPAMPVEARIGVIIAKYALFGLVPIVIPSLFPSVPLPIKEIPFQKGTDLNYVSQLAKENGYVFYVEPGPVPGVNFAYWGPEIRVGVPQSALTVNSDSATTADALSFVYDGSSREQLAILIQEPITKLPIPIPIPEISLLSPPLAVRQASALKFKFLSDSAKLDPLKAVALGLGKVSESADAITGSGQLNVFRYGHILQARRLVGVRGAGTAYDGLYYVKSVTHNLTLHTGEYKQSFTLARNGLVSLTPAVIP